MSRQYVQIANEIIRDPNLSSIDFVILVKLKQIQYYCKADRFEVNVKDQLRRELNIEDNRTIKKSLSNLFKLGYILEEATLDSHSLCRIRLNVDLCSPKTNFTHIYTKMLNHIKDIDFNGFRLLAYYESYINRRDSRKLFCYMSIETIKQETGLHKATIIKYNRVLVDKRLLEVVKHDLGTDYRYSDEGKIIFNKFNNHYTVRLENIL